MMGNGTGDMEALRDEIRRTRVELGETMEALAAKVDVRARLKSSAEQAKQRMRGQATQTMARVRGQAARGAEAARAGTRSSDGDLLTGPAPWAALAAGAVATMIVLLIVKGRQR